MATISANGRTFNGPTFEDIFKLYRQEFGVLGYTKAEINNIMRYAGATGGRIFIDVFLSKRFEMGYAKMLGYSSSEQYNDWKQRNVGRVISFSDFAPGLQGKTKSFTMSSPQPGPWRASGDSKKTTLESARAVVVVRNDITIIVKCRTGNINFTSQYASFAKVLDTERVRVQAEVERTLRLELLPMAKAEMAAGGRLPEVVTRYTNANGKAIFARNAGPAFNMRSIVNG